METIYHKNQVSMSYSKSKNAIQDWALGERPREKWLKGGPKGLSDAEVLAIILGSGQRGESAVDMARRLLQNVNYQLDTLGKYSVQELQQFSGIGPAKAISILAALELGRRRQAVDLSQKPQIRSSSDAYKILSDCLQDLQHEEFWIILLNRANRVIGLERISIGGVSGTLVDAKIVFRKAIGYSASSIILGHNHPSGSLVSSQADRHLTQKIVEAGKLMDVSVLDHLILTNTHYHSMADAGEMTSKL